VAENEDNAAQSKGHHVPVPRAWKKHRTLMSNSLHFLLN